ncbi:MAG: DUF697 domain-containing protein [Acaryochloridaceae cyanobacterium RL_2_7]|nr:DUF697 domain-containing protein [Acaryochloridaceae cyanobacterium RL_2_7]
MAQGDLTQSELTRIEALQANHQPCLVILNKVDQFRRAQLEALLQKRMQVLKTVDRADQIAIAAHPQTMLVRRHQEDGSFVEVEEQPTPQLTELTQRLAQRLSPEGRQDLVLQQAYNQAEQLRINSIQTLNTLRRQRALPVLEKYQWLSASAAFASPLPSTDMIATAAITAKLITELGRTLSPSVHPGRSAKYCGDSGQGISKAGTGGTL